MEHRQSLSGQSQQWKLWLYPNMAGAQLGRKGGTAEASPALFENQKRILHKFFIRKVSRRKNSNISPSVAFFVCVFDEIFIDCPISTKRPLT